MSERMADSSERAEPNAVEGISKGDKEEAADSPARRIPSRIGLAEAEEENKLGNARRIRKKDRI